MIKDIVFEEIYAQRVKSMVEEAYVRGQISATQILFTIIETFEKSKIEVTSKGLREYIESLKVTKTEETITKAEELIKKAEETLPTPNNITNLFGRKK
jgi:hypothetical protein